MKNKFPIVAGILLILSVAATFSAILIFTHSKAWYIPLFWVEIPAAEGIQLVDGVLVFEKNTIYEDILILLQKTC